MVDVMWLRGVQVAYGGILFHFLPLCEVVSPLHVTLYFVSFHIPLSRLISKSVRNSILNSITAASWQGQQCEQREKRYPFSGLPRPVTRLGTRLHSNTNSTPHPQSLTSRPSSPLNPVAFYLINHISHQTISTPRLA